MNNIFLELNKKNDFIETEMIIYGPSRI